MRFIDDTQPPESELSGWLMTLVDNINASIGQMHDHDPIYTMPDHQFTGMVRYFGAPVLPDITAEGLWVKSSTIWIQL
jgi:hypothetical protein